MKTTICITNTKRIVVEPNKAGQIVIDTGPHNELLVLSEDQAGALLFAIEVAAEAIETKRQREGAGPHAGASNTGQE